MDPIVRWGTIIRYTSFFVVAVRNCLGHILYSAWEQLDPVKSVIIGDCLKE